MTTEQSSEITLYRFAPPTPCFDSVCSNVDPSLTICKSPFVNKLEIIFRMTSTPYTLAKVSRNVKPHLTDRETVAKRQRGNSRSSVSLLERKSATLPFVTRTSKNTRGFPTSIPPSLKLNMPMPSPTEPGSKNGFTISWFGNVGWIIGTLLGRSFSSPLFQSGLFELLFQLYLS